MPGGRKSLLSGPLYSLHSIGIKIFSRFLLFFFFPIPLTFPTVLFPGMETQRLGTPPAKKKTQHHNPLISTFQYNFENEETEA